MAIETTEITDIESIGLGFVAHCLLGKILCYLKEDANLAANTNMEKNERAKAEKMQRECYRGFKDLSRLKVFNDALQSKKVREDLVAFLKSKRAVRLLKKELKDMVTAVQTAESNMEELH